MLLIPCPWCGPRDEAEFHYGGQAHVAYPENPSALTDEEWARYLFFRDNPKGPFAERWTHAAGCRRWFNAVRDTGTNEILAVYRAGEPRPGSTASPLSHLGALLSRRSAPSARLGVPPLGEFEDEAPSGPTGGLGAEPPELSGRGGAGKETQPFRHPTRGRINRDQPSDVHLRRHRIPRLPRRHPRLRPPRQRRHPDRHQHQTRPPPRHLLRRRRRTQRRHPDRGPVPRADAPRHDGRAVRRPRGDQPPRPGPPRHRPRPRPLRRRTRPLRPADRRRGPGRPRRRSRRRPHRRPRHPRRRPPGAGRQPPGHRPNTSTGRTRPPRCSKPPPTYASCAAPPSSATTTTTTSSPSNAAPTTSARQAPENVSRERVWRIRARRVVLATGAHERSLAFADNDRPGVMLAASARTYVNRHGVLPGRRAVVFTTNDSAYAAALDLAAAGVDVAAIVDTRPYPGEWARAGAGGRYRGAGRARGRRHGRRRAADRRDGRPVRGGSPGRRNRRAREFAADLLLVSGGWNPVAHLFSQAGGKLRYDEALGSFVPDTCRQAVEVAGSANGVLDLARSSRRAWPPVPARSRPRATPPRRPACPSPTWPRSPRRRPCTCTPSPAPPAPTPFRRPPTRCHRRRPDPRHRRRHALRRAHQALHHGRHRQRPGQDVRSAGQRHRRRPARRRHLGPRHDHVPAAVHARLLRHARRPRPGRAARPGPDDRPARLARRARRPVRERRPVEAPLVLPPARRGHGGRRPARVRRRPRRRRPSWTPPPSARSTYRARTRPSSSTGSTPT